jgi:hypothetical protein
MFASCKDHELITIMHGHGVAVAVLVVVFAGLGGTEAAQRYEPRHVVDAAVKDTSTASRGAQLAVETRRLYEHERHGDDAGGAGAARGVVPSAVVDGLRLRPTVRSYDDDDSSGAAGVQSDEDGAELVWAVWEGFGASGEAFAVLSVLGVLGAAALVLWWVLGDATVRSVRDTSCA